jgi:hypothetical protein
MKIFSIGRKARPGIAYMVTSAIDDDYTVICVCADLAAAIKRARDHNRDNRVVRWDYRARVEEVAFIPPAKAI